MEAEKRCRRGAQGPRKRWRRTRRGRQGCWRQGATATQVPMRLYMWREGGIGTVVHVGAGRTNGAGVLGRACTHLAEEELERDETSGRVPTRIRPGASAPGKSPIRTCPERGDGGRARSARAVQRAEARSGARPQAQLARTRRVPRREDESRAGTGGSPSTTGESFECERLFPERTLRSL